MKIKIKEGQKVLDVEGNTYLIERGDLLENNNYMTLVGTIKNKDYKISIENLDSYKNWSIGVFELGKEYNTELYVISDFTSRGSKEQAFAQVFLTLGLKVPKTEDMSGSGLDISYMVEVLKQVYKFKEK